MIATTLSGRVIYANDQGWNDSRRGFAARVDYDDQQPRAIVFAQCAEDVANAVRWARANNVPMRIRSGRHSYEGYSSLVKGGLILDVSELADVSFDPETGYAMVGAGIDMLKLTEKLFDVGVTIPLATGPSVGLGGLCQGGGVGMTSRLLGLTCDSVVDIEVVNSEGRIVRANEREHPDLYWALRGGGGGNFGVATSFTFKTHPLSTVGIFNITYRWDDFVAIVDTWQKWAPFADWGLTSLISLRVDRTITIQGQYTAMPQDMPKLEGLLDPVLAIPPLAVQTMVVPALRGAKIAFRIDPATSTSANHQPNRMQLFKSTSGVAIQLFPIEAILRLKDGLESVPPLSTPPSQPSMVQLLGGGGQAAVPKSSDTAVYYRNALFVVQYDGYWTAPQDEQPTTDWVVNLRRSMLPYASGAYVNYVDAQLGPDWLEQYYGSNLPRLREIKRKYDPENFFSFPQSIPPA